LSIQAGLNLELYRDNLSTDGTIIFRTDKRFGKNGGILLIDYTKDAGSSESSVNIFGSETFIYQDFLPYNKQRHIDSNIIDVQEKLWAISEVDVNGVIHKWYRTVNESGQYNFPLPSNNTYSTVYITIFLDDANGITSDLKIHILDNS
jgi:hypothetical protein